MNKTINGILKKAVSLGLCLTFTSSLMSIAKADEKNLKNIEFCNKMNELFKARDEHLNVAIEDAKEKVCENLKISRELLDETTKNVKIAATLFGEITEYIQARNLIVVTPYDMIMDELSIGANKETNLARELALAFIDNYLHKDREEVLAERVIIKAFADLCDKNIVPDSKRMDTPINLNEICCDKKQASGIYKNKIRRNCKYLAQKWLEDGKITPLEVLDKIKSGKSTKDILLENGGLKVLENWVEEDSIRG